MSLRAVNPLSKKSTRKKSRQDLKTPSSRHASTSQPASSSQHGEGQDDKPKQTVTEPVIEEASPSQPLAEKEAPVIILSDDPPLDNEPTEQGPQPDFNDSWDLSDEETSDSNITKSNAANISASRIYRGPHLTSVQKVDRLLDRCKHAKRAVVAPVKKALQETIKDLSGVDVQEALRETTHSMVITGTGMSLQEGRYYVKNFTKSYLKIRHKDSNFEAFHDRTVLEKIPGINDPAVKKSFQGNLLAIYYAWPFSGPPESKGTRRLMFETAVLTATGSGLSLSAPTWTGTGFKLRMTYIDETTCETELYTLTTNQPLILNNVSIDIPAHVNFYNGDARVTVPKQIVDGKAVFSSLLPTDRDIFKDDVFKKTKPLPTLVMMQARENFLRWLQYEFHGIITTSEKLIAMVRQSETAHTREVTPEPPRIYVPPEKIMIQKQDLLPNPNTGLPRINDLVHVDLSSDPQSVHFVFAKAPLRKLGALLKSGRPHFSIIFHTRDGRWLSRVFDVATQTLAQEFDFKDGLYAFAGAIDDTEELIYAGVEPPALCSCSDDMRAMVSHPCY